MKKIKAQNKSKVTIPNTNTLPVYNQDGKQVQKLKIDPTVFDGKVNQDVLYQVVLMYRANRRKGLVKP